MPDLPGPAPRPTPLSSTAPDPSAAPDPSIAPDPSTASEADPARWSPSRLRRSGPRLVLGAALAVGLATPLLPEPATSPLRLAAPAASAAAEQTPAPERSAARASRSGARAPLGAQDAVAPAPLPAPTLEPVRQRTDSPIAFRTVRREDPERYRGTERVVQQGREGVLRREHLVVGAGGREVSRTVLSEERVREPRDHVVAVGTRPRPRYRTDLDWAALARCESGGDPRAVSSSGRYRGLYQFDLRTWRSVGGTGDPVDHDREEQTFRASRLYEARGRSPWPHCGRHL